MKKRCFQKFFEDTLAALDSFDFQFPFMILLPWCTFIGRLATCVISMAVLLERMLGKTNLLFLEFSWFIYNHSGSSRPKSPSSYRQMVAPRQYGIVDSKLDGVHSPIAY